MIIEQQNCQPHSNGPDSKFEAFYGDPFLNIHIP
jgi:hypothetical protein